MLQRGQIAMKISQLLLLISEHDFFWSQTSNKLCLDWPRSLGHSLRITGFKLRK